MTDNNAEPLPFFYHGQFDIPAKVNNEYCIMIIGERMEKMMRNKLTFLVVAFIAICIQCYSADNEKAFSVHKVFGDHMVLQRQKPIKIGGTAIPHEKITVSIGENSSNAVADDRGKWLATLPMMKAGGPYEVKVKNATGKEIVLKDVLIGEVWMCSGQSNMQMPVHGRQFFSAKNGREEVKNASYPKIRLYNTTRIMSPKGPREKIVGSGWRVCSPKTVGPFSAVGYFFGRQLYKDLNIPIGLVNSSWGGTPIESWISREGYESAERGKELKKMKIAHFSPEEKINAVAEENATLQSWRNKFNTFDPEKTKHAEAWKNTDFNDSAWDKMNAGESFPYRMDSLVWCRKTIEIPQAWQDKELVLNLGIMNDCDETFFNGQKVGSMGMDVGNYQFKPRVYQVPGKLVKAGKAVIAMRIFNIIHVGLRGPVEMLKIYPKDNKNDVISLGTGWACKVEVEVDFKKIGKRPEINGIKCDFPAFPSTLYNSMIAPWTLYPMRGLIWYQGESNVGRHEDYMILHPLLVKDWRRQWNDSDFAFVFVQLAAFQHNTPQKRFPDNFWDNRKPGDSAWAKLREVQTATLNISNTGMAVTIDVGDHSDVHPADKQTVGYRLAKEAERICYGKKDVSAGPLYEKMKIEGNKIRVYFKNTGSGLVAKAPKPEVRKMVSSRLQEFAIAGEDGKFVWAEAEIDGDTVLVWSDDVASPKAVRYAWANYPPNPNLYNKEGFAASPFRTDQPDYLLKK